MTPEDRQHATIAVVTSSTFDFEGPESEYDEATPPGKDFASFVLKRLVAFGAKELVSPVSGEEGWLFDVEISRTPYRVFVHWAPIGTPPEDRWIIQPDIRKGILRALVGRATTDQEVAPLIQALQQAIAGATEVRHVQWITREEFAKIY